MLVGKEDLASGVAASQIGAQIGARSLSDDQGSVGPGDPCLLDGSVRGLASPGKRIAGGARSRTRSWRSRFITSVGTLGVSSLSLEGVSGDPNGAVGAIFLDIPAAAWGDAHGSARGARGGVMSRYITSLASGSVLLLMLSAAAEGASIFGPTPYESQGDIPAGFYAGGSPTFLEDFEDSSLDGGLTVACGPGAIYCGITSLSGFPGTPDSVDLDDAVADHSGATGDSWVVAAGSVGITFAIPGGFTAAGLVWTDGVQGGVTTFEAFGPGMIPLGAPLSIAIGDGSFNGETLEDRFFGVQDPGGVIAIRLTTPGDIGIEVDHVQYGLLPEPSSALLLGSGLCAEIALRRRGRA